MNSTTRTVGLVLLCFFITLSSCLASPRQFSILGTGVGHAIWKNGSIPMWVNVTKDSNKEHVSATLAKAAKHIADRTCVRFYEVATPPNSAYVTVKDDIANSCSAGYRWSGSGILNYDGCKHQYLTVVHEMMHILGIGHEQKRIDAYDKLKLNASNMKPDYVRQYTPTFSDAFGEYDWNSVMHYRNSYFDNGNGPTYSAIRTGFRVKCDQMSDGDISTIDFVAQSCWKEPMMPRCKTSSPSGLVVGKKFDKNMSFVAVYKQERMKPTFTNLPEGATVHYVYKYHGSVYMVELKPTENDAGKNFSITATYTTTDGKQTACTIPVKIVTDDYVCNNIPSNDPSTCSGHGICKSHDYPQCACQAGYGGPFCEGTTRCPADVNIEMEKDQQGRCLIPDEGVVNRVAGPTGEDFAANGTSLSFRLMDDIVRQPTEVSALVKVMGGEDGYHSVSMGYASVSISKRKVNSHFDVDGGWHQVRASYDWDNRQYMTFIDGVFARSGRVTTSSCKDLNNYNCAVDTIRASASGTGASIALDRVRLGCAATHIGTMTSMQLTASNRMNHNISIMFLAPHSAYVWDISNLDDLCTATDNAVLTGATYQLNATDKRRLNLTLPQLGTQPQPYGTNYITCTPTSKHFVNKALPVESWSQKLFAVGSLCSGGGKATFHDVKLTEWSHTVDIAEHTAWLNFSVPLLSDSEWEMSLFNEASKRAMKVHVKPESKRLRLFNDTKYLYSYDDRFQQLTHANLTLTLNWTTLRTIGKPTLTARLLDVEVSQEFTAATVKKVQMYYWKNSPNGTVAFEYGCPAAVLVPRPPLWPGDQNSTQIPTETPTTPPTTQAPPTTAPLTAAPTTLAPTTSAPTTAAPQTNVPTTFAPATSSPPTPAPGGDLCDGEYMLSGQSPSSQLSIDQINAILKAHNDERRIVSPPAKVMPMLQWKQELADFAKEYMESCVGMVHSTSTMRKNITRFGFSYVGENLAAGYTGKGDGGSTDAYGLATGGVKSTLRWNAEKADFTYSSGTSGTCSDVCGHYTQVVWHSTTHVGCGYAHCPGLKYKNYWSCVYGAGGNYRGQEPWVQAATASEYARCQKSNTTSEAPPTSTLAPLTTTVAPPTTTTNEPMTTTAVPPTTTAIPTTVVTTSVVPETTAVPPTTLVPATDEPTTDVPPATTNAPETTVDPTTTAVPDSSTVLPQTTLEPTTAGPPQSTTAAPTTVEPTSAEPVTTESTSTTAAATETQQAATAEAPMTTIETPTPSASPATTAPPSTSGTKREYRIRLRGTQWDSVLRSSRGTLEAAVKHDVAQRLSLPAERVVVESMEVGSLVCRVSITSDDATEPALADHESVASQLRAAPYTKTRDEYVQSGGSPSEDTSVAAVDVTDSGDGGTEPDGKEEGGGNENSCGGGCIATIVVVSVGVVGLAVGGLVWHRRRMAASGSGVADSELGGASAESDEADGGIAALPAPPLPMADSNMKYATNQHQQQQPALVAPDDAFLDDLLNSSSSIDDILMDVL